MMKKWKEQRVNIILGSLPWNTDIIDAFGNDMRSFQSIL